jgi:adenylyl cyclase-associated protein
MLRSQAVLSISKVTKDKQTWRKEFKNEGPSSLPAAPLKTQTMKKDEKKKKPLMGLPIFEYQDRGFKWVIENHTKESVTKEVAKDGIITVEISDPKQQVYFYNCEGVTVKVVGKFKSLILDKCTGCSVIYDSLISIAETVNCKKIQLQVLGVCPAFTIDKTIGCLIWLSAESKEISTFTTNLSSELNVSFPDGDEQKEVPIPEQFVHRLTNGSLKSEVSDLYH